MGARRGPTPGRFQKSREDADRYSVDQQRSKRRESQIHTATLPANAPGVRETKLALNATQHGEALAERPAIAS
jgi:hypothetical protein